MITTPKASITLNFNCEYAEDLENILKREDDVQIKDISNGLVDYSIRCLKGIHRGKFFYINLTAEGEIIGGDPNDTSLTLYMENSNLDNRHIQIVSLNCLYFLKDLNSSTGTYTKQGNEDPILITDGMEMIINGQSFFFSFGSEIDDTISQWLNKYNLGMYTEKVKQMGYVNVAKFGEIKMTDSLMLTSNREDRELLMQAIRDIPIDLG